MVDLGSIQTQLGPRYAHVWLDWWVGVLGNYYLCMGRFFRLEESGTRGISSPTLKVFVVSSV